VRHPEQHIFEHTPESLAQWCEARGLPAYRAGQVLRWVYERGVADPLAMTDLPRSLRDRLAEEFAFLSGPTVAHQVASDGTQKLLIEWAERGASQAHADVDHATRLPLLADDGSPGAMPYGRGRTECVMIPSLPRRSGAGGRARRTACVSSQLGCPVGCRFCASGLGGLEGNLSGGRIVEQVWRLGRLEGVGSISHVVFMGMGEPLANFRAVTHAVRTLSASWGLGISGRRITISTVGLPAAIERLARELDVPVTLALSLHAPTDELRRQLIPWAQHATIEQLLAATGTWFDKTGREITLEYTLLGGVNDRPEHARLLADLARGMRASVNLIRYNEVDATPYRRPRAEDVHAFQRVLVGAGVRAPIRASRGRDIAAACGQLAYEVAAGAGRAAP